MRVAAVVLVAFLVVPSVSAFGASEADRAASLLSLPEGVTSEDVAAAGLVVLEDFAFARVVRVAGPPEAVAGRAAALGARAYPVEAIELHLAETRARVRADVLPLPLPDLGRGVAVAVVDSGVDESHPALADRVRAHVRVSDDGVQAATGDATGHGTHVAGIVAGSGAGAERNRGLAPAAGLVAVDISSSFTTTNAIRGFEWLARNAEAYDVRVVVNSWGRTKEDARYDPDDPLTRAVHALVDRGLVVVFSAGNKGPGPSTLTQEAMDPRVITVGATDDAGRLESYSGRGPALDARGDAMANAKPDLLAPGSDVVSTRAGGGYVEMDGTSMATPHVAAAAAVLLARFPDLTADEVRAALVAHADAGVLDVASAFEAVAAERRVVVEKRVPLALDGSVLALAGRVLEGGPARFDVPAAATRLELTVRADAQAPEGVRAVLAKDGRAVATAEGAGALALRVEDPAPGAWTLDVQPAGAGGKAEWRAEGALTVTEIQEAAPPEEPVSKASAPVDADAPRRMPGGLGKVATLTAAFAVVAGAVGVRRK